MAEQILLVGEAWITYSMHIKGFAGFETGSYGEGAGPLRDALQSGGHDVTYLPTTHVSVHFPSSAEGLSGYLVVILSDVPSDTILLHPETFENGRRTPDRLAELASYVMRGGSLLMIGGYMSFYGIYGRAHYRATALRDILPVELEVGDDRIERPAGVVPKVINQHAILEGLSDWPHLLGYNRFAAKPGSQTLLMVGNDPLLVIGEVGAGRVAAFASDCAPHWGSPEFLAWSGYPTFWNNLVNWLSDTHPVNQ